MNTLAKSPTADLPLEVAPRLGAVVPLPFAVHAYAIGAVSCHVKGEYLSIKSETVSCKPSTQHPKLQAINRKYKFTCPKPKTLNPKPLNPKPQNPQTVRAVNAKLKPRRGILFKVLSETPHEPQTLNLKRNPPKAPNLDPLPKPQTMNVCWSCEHSCKEHVH